MSSSSESSSLEQPPTVQYPKGQPPTDPYLKDQPPMDPPLTDFNPMRSSHSCPCVKDPPPIELPKDPLPIELPKDSHSSNESVVLQEEAETRDYFAYAVLSALFFLPVGIFAIVCSYQVSSKDDKNDPCGTDLDAPYPVEQAAQPNYATYSPGVTTMSSPPQPPPSPPPPGYNSDSPQTMVIIPGPRTRKANQREDYETANKNSKTTLYVIIAAAIVGVITAILSLVLGVDKTISQRAVNEPAVDMKSDSSKDVPRVTSDTDTDKDSIRMESTTGA
ncbi:hypothetical protein C0Q70_16752 [Pomacea canaliculata]|uniref:Uncharacterized protein n=1 Tax=Pomacea canaliculata TaxID=400727 RepID=A0A2T7NQN0_POMCA|nr:hypothetical protein C0Q70_16752 [Pomacea canaliculata]